MTRAGPGTGEIKTELLGVPVTLEVTYFYEPDRLTVESVTLNGIPLDTDKIPGIEDAIREESWYD